MNQKNHLNGSVSNLADVSVLPITWRKETHGLSELLTTELRKAPDRTVLMKSFCKRTHCQCALKQHKILILRAAHDVTFSYGTWMKQRSMLDLKSNAPYSEKLSRLLLPMHFKGWFEILNENYQSISHWTTVREVVRFKPRVFLIRKDIKCLSQKLTANGKLDLHVNSTIVIKAGTVLTFLEFNVFRVHKSRGRTKDLPLLKCSDTSNRVVYLSIEEKCSISPVAGKENISGVHQMSSILRKFRVPLNIRQLFQSPMTGLSYSDRNLLRLSACYRGDLFFISALDNPERFYVITASMLEDHTFQLGDSDRAQHQHILNKHSTRVAQFLSSCHPYESLRYLIKHLVNVTNKFDRPGGPPKSASSATNLLDLSPSPSMNGVSREESDRLYKEVDEIYCYVRTGRLPTSRATSQTTLNRPHLNNSSQRPLPAPRKHIASKQTPTHSAREPDKPSKAAFRSSSYDNLLETIPDGAPQAVPLKNYDPGETRPNLYAGHVVPRRRRINRLAEGDRRRYSTDCSPMKMQMRSPSFFNSQEQL